MTLKDEVAPAAKRPAAPVSPATPKSSAKAPVVSSKKMPTKPAPKAKAAVAPKTAAKSLPKATPKASPKAPAAKIEKPKKPKMVRDSFTFPKAEYEILDVLKLRAAKLGHPVKKTELLRAGIKAIAAMQDAAFIAALKVVPNLKTGRPAKAKAN